MLVRNSNALTSITQLHEFFRSCAVCYVFGASFTEPDTGFVRRSQVGPPFRAKIGEHVFAVPNLRVKFAQFASHIIHESPCRRTNCDHQAVTIDYQMPNQLALVHGIVLCSTFAIGRLGFTGHGKQKNLKPARPRLRVQPLLSSNSRPNALDEFRNDLIELARAFHIHVMSAISHDMQFSIWCQT